MEYKNYDATVCSPTAEQSCFQLEVLSDSYVLRKPFMASSKQFPVLYIDKIRWWKLFFIKFKSILFIYHQIPAASALFVLL